MLKEYATKLNYCLDVKMYSFRKIFRFYFTSTRNYSFATNLLSFNDL